MNTFNTTPIAFMNLEYQKIQFITPKQFVFYLYHGVQFLTSIKSHCILGNDTK